jgi:hypothetical protein
MAKRRRGVAVLTVAAVAGAGVAAGVVLTRGTPGDADASSAAAPTTSPAPLGDESGFEDVSPTPTASIGPDPDTGQTVATDAPDVVTTSEVPVTITWFGYDPASEQVQLAGFVGGVVEDGGVCTLTLTRGGTAVRGDKDAVADASTTSCGELDVAGSKLSPGTWQAVLSYTSAGHTGTSETVDVEVTT